jgi:hypothetical protein
MKKRILCQGLEMTISLEPDPAAGENPDGKDGPGLVRLRLEDPLQLRECELTCEIGSSTLQSRGYHIQEAIVIGLRRLLDAAIKLEIVLLPYPIERPGGLMSLNVTLPISEASPIDSWTHEDS